MVSDILNKDLYSILNVSRESTSKEIKTSYRKLSFLYHPDINKNKESEEVFKCISEAYKVLIESDSRSEYDRKSKWGNNYDEISEFLDYEFGNPSNGWDKSKLDSFKKNEGLNIVYYIDNTFNGTIEYERWVVCKGCKGSGKDVKSKIEIKDSKGNVVKIFDSDGGCDFCFEENNYVVTKRGDIKISDIKINDMVLSKNNEYRKVTHLLNRTYTGTVLDINASGLKINGVTENHKINIIRFKRNNQGRIKIKDYEILEVPAIDILKTDFIIYQTQINDNYKNEMIIEKTLNRKEKLITINSDFIKFIACYIAEGNTRGDRVTVFTFHKEKDTSLINFIAKYSKNIFNTNVKFIKNKKWGNKVSKIEIYNSQLSKFIKNFCGNLAENKFINLDILGKNDKLLLETLLLCDGYKKENSNTSTYTTISKKLAHQVFHIGQLLGYNSSIGTYDDYIDKDGVNHMICYRIYITKSKKMGITKKFIKEGICLKIKDISIRNVKDINVYNITVDTLHKYTINGLLVNNCEGSGKDYNGQDCSFCFGQGKVGNKDCEVCSGQKRILGKQKLSKIKIPKGNKDHKVDFMGNFSRDIPGKVGHLWIVKKDQD